MFDEKVCKQKNTYLTVNLDRLFLNNSDILKYIFYRLFKKKLEKQNSLEQFIYNLHQG